MFSTGLCELVLIVRDVAAAARFYRDVVGLTPAAEPTDDWAWFWAGAPGPDGAGHFARVALHKGPLLHEEHSPRPLGQRWGPVHFALLVPRERLGDAVAHLRSQGVAAYGPTRLEWMAATSWYFYDPDDNLLEFWSPDPR
jgi:catechol 2,3-dioxygenase-like lactoylglutathione lyase family enzyme